MKTSDLVEMWLKASKPKGKASSAYFEGDKIVSYGTVMAQRIRNRSGNVGYLLNDERYSNTTSILQGIIRSSMVSRRKSIHGAGDRPIRFWCVLRSDKDQESLRAQKLGVARRIRSFPRAEENPS